MFTTAIRARLRRPSTAKRPAEFDSVTIESPNDARGRAKKAGLAAFPNLLVDRKSVQLKGRRCLVNPQSTFMRTWDFLMIVLLFFTAVVTPFEVAFLETSVNALFVLNRLIDALFIWVRDLINPPTVRAEPQRGTPVAGHGHPVHEPS